MKQIYLLLIALLMLISACQESRFATTTRQCKKGKVTYVNHYSTERRSSSKVIRRKEADGQHKTSFSAKTVLPYSSQTENEKISQIPIQEPENLIASASKEPVIIAGNQNLVLIQSSDTTKSITQHKKSGKDSIAPTIIKFKNGQKESVNIISRSQDTLKYELLTDKGVVRTVLMEQVDTILHAKVPQNHKTNNSVMKNLVALLLVLVGLIFYYGLPIVTAAIILVADGLIKLNENQGRFKGKGWAIACVIIGSCILVVFFILIFLAASGQLGSTINLGWPSF